MKTAAKVFIVIGCVMLFWLIYPVFIGVMAYKKLDTACSKNELVGLTVAVLLCVNVLAGIFMLCISDQDLLENAETSTAAPTVTQPRSIKAADGDRAFDELIAQNVRISANAWTR